jgi:FlaA1/EpsC-like NDP-sugar epimerase
VRVFKRMRNRPLRFSPTAWQVTALDAVFGAAGMTVAMVLRFLDEGSIPATYAQRLAPWLVIAAVIQILSGELTSRLRRPRAPLAGRPVLPFIVGTISSVLLVAIVNDVILREPLWHMPHFVSIVGPLLGSAASAAMRLASSRSIDLEELLTRPIIQLDLEACAPVLAGKRVLITGAAGSIGAELARQLQTIAPADVLAVDTNETGLYELQGEIPGIRTCIADVCDARRMRELFLNERPDVVFHAAAYKHVPLVEANPDQGFSTNVLGTLAVCEAAVAAQAERVVVISTDKAVNPSSFMGLTKRVAELMVIALSQTSESSTLISAVRFGNVLGSRGSVIPTLLRQIDAGGPITITHPEAQRFFMTVSEAASLVLLSAAYGSPGGVFVLDMGDEVRIEQLAARLVRLKGLRPGRDVAIQYIGLRPGEKLREELHSADERLLPTERPAVWRVEPNTSVDPSALLSGIRALDARRRSGKLEPADYPTLLRDLIAQSTAQNEVHVAKLVPQIHRA